MADAPKAYRLQGTDGKLNRLWIGICRIWCFFSVLILIMVIVAEIIIMQNSITRYNAIYGAGNAPSRGYDRDPSGSLSGYVALTNVPKRLGSIFWSSSFQTAIILFCILVGFGDAAMVYKRPDNYAQKSMRTFKGSHLTPYYADDPQSWNGDNEGKLMREPYWIAGLGLLKLFITAAYQSQSFYGLSRGVEYGQLGQVDNQLYCLWAGWILFGSIVPTALAQAFAYIRQENHRRGKSPNP